MIIYYISAVDLSNYDAQRTHILEVISEIQNNDEDVTLFTPKFSKTSENFNFKHHYIPILLKYTKLKFIEYEFSLTWVLLWHLIKKRPDIIYIRKGFLTIVPTLLSRMFNINCIIEVNGYLEDELQLSFGLPKKIIDLFNFVEKYNLHFADKIVTVTEGIKRLLSEKHNIDLSKINVIPNGVNINKFYPKKSENKDNHYLGFVGNLVNWSGLEYLIKSIPEVLKHIKNVNYLIVGDGTQQEYLQNLATNLNVSENVIFTGFVPSDEVPDYINKCEICFLPAARRRNAKIGISPIKLYEYLACGVPVIVSKIEGMEFVSKIEAGIVVEPENSNLLKEATLQLLNDSKMRERMSNNARLYIENNFTWQISTQKILDICNHLIN